MKIQLCLTGIKPLTLNSAYPTNKMGRRFKSDKYQQFESKISCELRKYKKEIDKVNRAFKKSTKHYIEFKYKFYMPVLVKDGSRISKTSGDLSNLIKTMEDVIFKNLIFDDSQVSFLSCEKHHSESIYTEVFITIV